MTDQMDDDEPTSSGLETVSASSSFEKLDPADLDQKALNDGMENHCIKWSWRFRLELAEHDASLWPTLISNVLMSLTSLLAATDAKSSVIATPTIDGADDIVTGFNDAELKHWKGGVRKGVKTNDWIGLITNSSTFRTIGSLGRI